MGQVAALNFVLFVELCYIGVSCSRENKVDRLQFGWTFRVADAPNLRTAFNQFPGNLNVDVGGSENEVKKRLSKYVHSRANVGSILVGGVF